MAGFGLRAAKSQGMEGFTGNAQHFPIDPSNTSPIFVGDPVILNGGNVEAVVTGTGATTPLLGVFSGWKSDDNEATYGGAKGPYGRYWSGAPIPGATSIMAVVNLPPHSLFHVRGNAAWAQATMAGAQFALVDPATTPGNAQYGDSRMVLDLAAGPSAGASIMVHRLVDDSVAAEPVVEVSILLQQLTAADAA